jgi:hypothetical protein
MYKAIFRADQRVVHGTPEGTRPQNPAQSGSDRRKTPARYRYFSPIPTSRATDALPCPAGDSNSERWGAASAEQTNGSTCACPHTDRRGPAAG